LKIIILGAGGFGREVLQLIHNINQVKPKFDVLGFLDDGIENGTVIHQLQVLGNIGDYDSLGAEGAVLAVGNTKTRKRIQMSLSNDVAYPNIIHPLAVFHDPDRTEMGKGNIICAGSIFTTDIKLGHFNIINLSCTVGHDVRIGSFCSIMPGVHVSGEIQLEDGVYVGSGATLIKSIKLGEFSTVGAGALVHSNVNNEQTVAGVPARPLQKK
jgi:sugar O-acyltransferase (sialic acid O-acetyltransferase NeuD family)